MFRSSPRIAHSMNVLLRVVPWLLLACVVHARKTCRVVPLPGGQDAGPSILDAFDQCRDGGKVVLDGYYSVDTVLQTTGSNLEIELSGTIQYTPDISKWSDTSIYLTYQNATTAWFLSGTNIHFHGGPNNTGTIDGNGQIWWDTYAENGDSGPAGGSSRTFARPIPLTIGNASNVLVEGIYIVNPPFWTNFVYQSSFVTYKNIRVKAKSFSAHSAANSDGWDIYRSDHVTIQDSFINNGDDCVSFKPNSTNIVVSNLNCTGSHGISVGSLGQYAGETDIVANVSVNGINMTNAQNGARIKVWGGSPLANSTAGGGFGYVKNVTFANFANNNVDNPILIDQCYSTSASQCVQYPSTLIISDIHYINVTGTSSSPKNSSVVVSLKCSSECENITAVGTHLISPKTGVESYVCQNVASVNQLDFNCSTG